MLTFIVIAFALFFAGYITARYSLSIIVIQYCQRAWAEGVYSRFGKGFLFLSIAFLLITFPIERIASREVKLKPQGSVTISAREQLRRRGSF